MSYCLGGKARNGFLSFRTHYFHRMNANEVSVEFALNFVRLKSIITKNFPTQQKTHCFKMRNEVSNASCCF